MVKGTASALFAAFLAVASLSAQTQVPRLGETIDVSIVNVDVVVTDRRGNHIRGLTAADFEIRDSGVPQPITNFAEYDDRVSASAPTRDAGAQAVATQAREKRTLVLFVERQVLPPKDADNFIVSMKELLHDTMRPGDTAAVVAFNYIARVEQEFTSDPARLDAAVDRLRPIFDRLAEDTEAQAIRNAYTQELFDQAAAESKTAAVPSLVLKGADGAVRELVDIRRKARSLNVLVNSMAAMEGRKAILLATRRFGEYAGWEFIGNTSGPPSHEMDERFKTRDLHEALAANANAAGVTFYSIYPEGLVDIPLANVEEGPRTFSSFYQVDRMADVARFSKSNGILLNETKAIGELAESTGGTSGWGITDVDKIVRTMSEDLSSYYSLAFRARGKTQKHKIDVTTKNRSYVVRARHEFVEKDDDMQMSERIISALYQPQQAATLAFEVRLLDVKKAKGRYRVPIVVRIPVASLTAIPGEKGRTGSFRIYSAAGGILGINSDVYQKSQPFTIPNGEDPKTFTYEFEMVTDYRADRIAIGVYDELSHQYGVERVRITKPTAPSRSNP